MAEEHQPKSKRECLICLLWFCCVLLTMAAFTFSMYTVKEFAMLKARIYELESQINQISGSNTGSLSEDFIIRNSPHSNAISPPRNEDKKRSFNGIIKTETQKPINRSDVFIHLIGGRNDKGTNVTDRNVIKHWMVSHSTDHVTYNAKEGFIQVAVPGYYYIYSQIQLIFKKWEKEIKKHETLINSKRVLSGMFGFKYKHGKQHGTNFDANYQGGVFKLQNGDRIFIRGNNKRGPLQKEANYFGTFLLAATPL